MRPHFPTRAAALVLRALLALAAGGALSPAHAQRDSKLLLTGGVSSIDGAAGGGLTPWAVIGSNATDRKSVV